MVTTKTTSHHQLWWARMTTNSSRYWKVGCHCRIASCSIDSNHDFVDSLSGWTLDHSNAIDQLAIVAGDPHSTSPTDDRAHCSPNEVRPGSVMAVEVGHATPQSLTDGQLRALVHSTPVLSSSWSTGAFESTTLVLQVDGWVWVQIRLSPGLHLVDRMTSHRHSIFDLDDQFQTNAPPHCPSARLRH